MASPRKLFQAIGATQQSARDAIGAISSADVGASSPGPWASVLYVDQVRGSDSTGARGNENFPFATIQAALNAAQTGDTVWLAPQHFTITSTLTIPNTVTYLTIRGTSTNPSNTSVSGTQPCSIIIGVGINALDLSTNTAGLRLSLFYVQFVNASAGFYSIVADGSLADLHLMRLHLNYCQGVSVYVRRILEVEFYSCQSSSANVFNGMGSVTVTNSVLSGASTLAYDVSVDPGIPSQMTVRQSILGLSTTSNKLTLTGQASLIVDDMSFVNGIVGSGLLAPSGGAAPSVSCSGYIGFGNVDFASAGSELPDTATALTFSFVGTRFIGPGSGVAGQPVRPATVIKFKVAGSAVNSQTIDMSCTLTGPTCAITADAGISLLGRGSSWPQAVLATPGTTGSITPPPLNGVVDVSAGGVQAKTWAQLGAGAGLIRTSVPTTVLLTDAVQAANSVAPTAGKLATGFTITNTGQGGNIVNWEARF